MILGGAQENTLLTCEGLHARGHDVTLVTGPAMGPEGQLMTRAKSGGYRVIEIDQMRRRINPIRDHLAYRRLLKLLRELRPDVMHSHSSKAGILARKAASKVGGMKIVHTVHGLAFHRYLSPWRNRLYVVLEKRAARRSDAIISVADAMTTQAVAAGVGRREQYTTIHSGMEIGPYLDASGAAEFRDSLGLDSDSLLVTQVSRLAELKGHQYIFDAAGRISDPRVRFCFVGDGHWRDRLEAEAHRRGLSDRFIFTGLLPPEQIPSVMAGSDIVVHCSLREGLARALPQAMLAARPVISFDIDGAREVVNDSTGVLLAPGDVDGLTAAIEKLTCDAELRAKLGATGREKCREMFSHDLMVDRIEELYRGLADS
jgi:glycosyltransferase involved in cell wall biosynthesis